MLLPPSPSMAQTFLHRHGCSLSARCRLMAITSQEAWRCGFRPKLDAKQGGSSKPLSKPSHPHRKTLPKSLLTSIYPVKQESTFFPASERKANVGVGPIFTQISAPSTPAGLALRVGVPSSVKSMVRRNRWLVSTSQTGRVGGLAAAVAPESGTVMPSASRSASLTEGLACKRRTRARINTSRAVRLASFVASADWALPWAAAGRREGNRRRRTNVDALRRGGPVEFYKEGRFSQPRSS